MYTVEEREAADLLYKKFQEYISDTIRQCRKDEMPAPGYDDIWYMVLLTHIVHLEMRIEKLENGLGDKPDCDITEVYILLTNALGQLEHGINTAETHCVSYVMRALHQRLILAKSFLVRGRNLFTKLSLENKPADDSTQP